MAVDESTRRLVHEWAAHSGGPDVAEVRGEMAELRSDMRGMRGMLPRHFANVASMFGFAGLVLAAVSID